MLRLWRHLIVKHRPTGDILPVGQIGPEAVHPCVALQMKWLLAAGVVNPVLCTVILFIIVTGHKGLMMTLFL